MRLAVRHQAVVPLRSAFQMSEWRALSVIETARMTVRYHQTVIV
jgi:hypothetical protein